MKNSRGLLQTGKFQLVLLATLSLTLAVPLQAQDSTGHFRFQPDKIDVGTVYHYLKTNIDGTHPERVSHFVAAKDRLEAFKFHPGGERAALVIADISWSNFSVRRLESWQVFRNGDKKLFATLVYLDDHRVTEVSIPPMGRIGERTRIGQLPFDVYNFDLGGLNFVFRHLIDPRKSFVIGIADPTFQDQGPVFKYRGEVTVNYEGEEIRHEVRCRKYRIGGPGLEHRGGIIWVNKTKGHIEDIEIQLPDNPDWQSFKFRLTAVEQMTRPQWEAFMKSQF